MEKKVAAAHFTLNHASLTQPIMYKESYIFCNNCPCANDSVYAKFEVPYVFMSFVFWALGGFLIT